MNSTTQSPSSDQVAQELSAPLLRYLRGYVGNATLAEDLLQETLIRIARALPTFEGRASVKTWAFSIATRVAADHFRGPAHKLELASVDECLECVDRDLPVEQRIVLEEMNACVRQVIESLPEDFRAALLLHDLEGLTAAQTAEACGCSVATAKIRIHRARLRLKEALQDQCEFYRSGENVLRCDRKA